MTKASRITLVVAAFCVGLGLSGCANGNFDLDPATWFPDGKKKLPGDRREVFPEGVPGVTQGIPPELVRGNQAQQTAQDPALAPAQEQQQQTQPQAQEKPKPKPKKVARPRPAPAPEPEADEPPAPRAAQPAPRQQAQPTSSGAWPAPQAQQQQQQQQAPASGAWPAPPAAGTFTR
ncbi:MAG: hypothetical protein ACO1NY_00970 [Pseudorhodoplanes sp.]